MNEKQEDLFGRYIAEYASEHNITLDDDGIMKAIELFDECAHQWQSDLSASIETMARNLGFDEEDEPIIGMVTSVWTKIYTE